MQKRNATVAVVSADDYIGAEIAKKFAAEGFTVFAGRRNGEKLEPLVKEFEAAGARLSGVRSMRGGRRSRGLPQRRRRACAAGSHDLNVGANVNFPILETTDRVFRKVWEMACWAGF